MTGWKARIAYKKSIANIQFSFLVPIYSQSSTINNKGNLSLSSLLPNHYTRSLAIPPKGNNITKNATLRIPPRALASPCPSPNSEIRALLSSSLLLSPRSYYNHAPPPPQQLGLALRHIKQQHHFLWLLQQVISWRPQHRQCKAESSECRGGRARGGSGVGGCEECGQGGTRACC